MNKMRTTTHHGRGKAGGAGKAFGSKHNDRNFDVSKANHIEPDLVKNNVTWNIYDGCTFEEAELRFYEEHFQSQLDETNANYRANGHSERCKKMDEWKKCRRHAPEETLIQVGDKHITGRYIDGDTLLDCFSELLAFELAWNEEHGRPFTLLNYALHVDEPGCPPHIHSRKVWHYRSEDRSLWVGQERALEQAGVELPHPDRNEGRYNNRKMTYDAMIREKWIEICLSRGIEIEQEPLPDGKKHKRSKDKEEYIRQKYADILTEIEAAEKSLAFQTLLVESESARADREHQRAEAAKEEARKMYSVVTELAELKTVADYQRQVVDNDRSLKRIIEGIKESYKTAAANQVPIEAARQMVAALVKAFSDIIEALRIGIARVKLFEAIRRLPEKHGERQERTLDNILANAYDDAAAFNGSEEPHQNHEIEK